MMNHILNALIFIICIIVFGWLIINNIGLIMIILFPIIIVGYFIL